MPVENLKPGPVQVRITWLMSSGLFALLVGRQFLEAEDILFSARHASYWESLEAGTHCFIMAIEVWCLCVCATPTDL